MTAGLGEFAALSTAVTWGFTNQVNSAVARKVGATSVALLRLPYMVLLGGLLCLVFRPDFTISAEALLLLTISGFLGIAVCDMLLYKAILIIGPTMALLVLSLSSGGAAIISWLFLQETLPQQAILGIVVSLTGVGVVVTEHSGCMLLPGQTVPRGKTLAYGVALAGAASFCLAWGYVAQRMAMQTGVAPLWAGFVRVASASVILWGTGCLTGWVIQAARSLVEQHSVRWLLLLSCSFGVLGMWFASVALAHAPAGIAATLISLQPIVVAIIGAVWYRRKPSFRVIAGSLVAFSGTALICLR